MANAKTEVNRNLLTVAEAKTYDLLLKDGPDSVPEEQERRLQTSLCWYWGIGIAAVIAAAVIGHACWGMTFAVGAAMYVAFIMGCGFGVAYTIQSALANDRLLKLRRKKADQYLEGIGYWERTGRTDRATSYSSGYGTGYEVKSRRQAQHEWYEGHSELDWRDRERAEMYGLDVDTYISNVLENDRD